MKLQPAPSPAIAEAVALIERRLDPAAVVLFGSMGEGRATPFSDVDLALLLGRRGADSAFEVRSVATDVEDILHRAVDLVVLDSSSPVLAMEVLRSGHLLSCADPDSLERFTVRTLTDYADLKITRRPIEQRLLTAGRR